MRKKIKDTLKNIDIHLKYAGFTLIELILAISILVIVFGTAYSLFSSLVRTKQILDDDRELSFVANVVIKRLTRELQLALPAKKIMVPPGFNAPGLKPCFVGNAQGFNPRVTGGEHFISFIASEAGQYIAGEETNAGIVQITYRIDFDPNNQRTDGIPVKTLVREELPFVDIDNTTSSQLFDQDLARAYSRIMIFPIADNLIDLKFRFFNNAQKVWVGDWGVRNNANILPDLIEFDITLISSDAKQSRFQTVVPVGATNIF
ncbi:MAG TPA: prepilin-type N-terminal cleavage/methylation domain-containing protein [Oligoflexia bacterium]|nr:prepilin-type N-terminal cleavage/methylation domain-containing protein [Oligoflexia bacterium]HMP27681.1 prepilin-type N-terminal cleavage/methylation domain-containing protein [Oligoflexia bacterium]